MIERDRDQGTKRQLLQDIIQWDVRSWSQAVEFWDRVVPWGEIRGPCLEIGSREGGLSLWLVLKGMQVVCSDLNRSQARASKLHKKYGVFSRIEYLDIDMTDIPFENHFEIVVFKSVLGSLGCAIKQEKAMQEIFKSLKPGGMLLFAENLNATLAHAWLREHVVGGYARNWRYVTLQEMQSYLAPFSGFQVLTTGFLALLGRTETQKKWLARVDQAVLNRVVPRGWRYIVYGTATK